MNEQKLRRFCLAMVIAAIALRFADSAASPPPAAPAVNVWPLEILAATPATPDASTPASSEPEPTPLPVLESDTPSSASAASAPLQFSASEADSIPIAGAATAAVDKASLLTRLSALRAPSADEPTVLIVHTHSSEAYTQETGWEYDSSDPLRTSDPDRSVIRIGTRLAELLNAHGISTLHDTALNDYPTYDGAYERMRLTIESYLAQYPSIQMVLDIHRDAAEDAAGAPVSFATELDGQRCAQLMLVVGTDEGGLTHPDWQENLANALKLQALLNRAAPGLCRALDLRTERFNQHETPGSLLIEFGCTGNTLSEALSSADYLAQALCTLWDGLS